jgi:hypothetical protein
MMDELRIKRELSKQEIDDFRRAWEEATCEHVEIEVRVITSEGDTK